MTKMTVEKRLLVEAFNLQVLSIEYLPQMGGARTPDNHPAVIPAQAVLYANFGGTKVRLVSTPLIDATPEARRA